MADYRVQILDSNQKKLAEIDDYVSMRWTRRYQKTNDFQLIINKSANGAEYIEHGNFINVLRDNQDEFRSLIGSREIEVTNAETGGGRQSEDWTVKGLDILSFRVCIPPTGNAYDTYNAPAETVMKSLVDKNAVNPDDPKRAFPFMTIEDGQARGLNVELSARYEPLLTKLNEAAQVGRIGYELDGTEFKIIQGVNRQDSVIFSPDFGNIETMKFFDSIIGNKNLAYAGGTGTGAARTIVEQAEGGVGAEPESIDRREFWIDASDLSGTSALKSRALSEIRKNGSVDKLETKILTETTFFYREDYDLGDTVGIRNLDWVTEEQKDGIFKLKTITEVEVFLEPQFGVKVDLKFDEPIPNFITAVKGEFNIRNVQGRE